MIIPPLCKLQPQRSSNIAPFLIGLLALLVPLIALGADDLQPGEVFRDCDHCPEMVVVPAGSFLMGSAENSGSREERPQHEVAIAAPMAIGRYPVTFTEYDRFAKSTGREEAFDDHWGRGRRPAVNVSWEDAKAYVEWLNEQTGQSFRLPSEAEWEYAARAGTKTQYSWGDDISPEQANYLDSGYRRTTEIGDYPANPWGLYDMHGNVWEWTADCWNDNFEGAPTDGRAWTVEGCKERVLRGGCWNYFGRFLRSAARFKLDQDHKNGCAGFRVVRDVSR